MTPTNQRAEDELVRYRAVTPEEAEEIEAGCTSHTIIWVTSPAGVNWFCHQRLGIRWCYR